MGYNGGVLDIPDVAAQAIVGLLSVAMGFGWIQVRCRVKKRVGKSSDRNNSDDSHEPEKAPILGTAFILFNHNQIE